MDLSVVKELTQEVKPASYYMRLGIEQTVDHPMTYITASLYPGCPIYACALGAAIVGKGLIGEYLSYRGIHGGEASDTLVKWMADKLDIPFMHALTVNSGHYRGKWSREDCAKFLEENGC